MHGVLRTILDRVFEEKYVELDPSKVEVKDEGDSRLHRPQNKAEVLEQGAQTLRAHVRALLSAYCRSVHACPAMAVPPSFRSSCACTCVSTSPAPSRRTCHSSPPPASCVCASSLWLSCRPSSSCGSGTRTPVPVAPCSSGPGCSERGQHGHAGAQGRGGVDGASAAHSAPGVGR